MDKQMQAGTIVELQDYHEGEPVSASKQNKSLDVIRRLVGGVNPPRQAGGIARIAAPKGEDLTRTPYPFFAVRVRFIPGQSGATGEVFYEQIWPDGDVRMSIVRVFPVSGSLRFVFAISDHDLSNPKMGNIPVATRTIESVRNFVNTDYGPGIDNSDPSFVVGKVLSEEESLNVFRVQVYRVTKQDFESSGYVYTQVAEPPDNRS